MFFSSMISVLFSRGLDIAFDFAAAACLVATVSSMMRYHSNVHEEDGVPAAGRAAASVGHNLEGGQGGVGRVGDPAAVGRHLAQRP